ncbi:sugar ABC transporter permease [Antiquaquibacter oligotrophicus]|uniref:carbohydrate ABC transporter permease n=1 Tax=Antiquaquibacter oligotrophicus TaxID=2880260 RepID=UPI002AC8E08A|nr:sugar ABC transporter permease [Antiquaquibacter oligotrophicus]UDF12656.1 sugar ABC transporter permease [Antiquaquibacter oligotrophicus]
MLEERPAPRRSPARRSAVTTGQNRAGWLLSLPFIVIFLTFTALPIVISLVIGFTDMRSSDLRNPLAVSFVGLSHFTDLFANPQFLRSLLNTGIYVVVGVPITLAVGFLLAVALNTGIPRFRTFFRAAFYVPVVTNIVAVATIWQYAFNARGPVNSALAWFGIDGPNWLGDPAFALAVIIALGVWLNFGTAMVLYLAGLQSVPEDVYEAAALDGAGRWRILFSITWPLLRPTTLLVSVLLTIFFLQVFEVPYVLTDGGPLDSTITLGLFTFNQFGFGDLGKAAASSYVMVLIVAVLGIVQFRLLRSKS